ncbi:hypothetical protein [Desulfolithobacter sp.]
MNTRKIPEEFKFIQERVLRVIKPIKPANDSTQAEKDFLFAAKRTQAGRSLPPYYLVYFLFVDLLGFKNLGQCEKVSWSVPIDYRGRAFLIEHRKFGLGIFARDSAEDEAAAGEIATLIHKGVKTARPYFDYIAQQAVSDSKVNVLNNSSDLYDRFVFLSKSVKDKLSEAEQRKDENDVDIDEYDGLSWRSVALPSARIRFEARWLALSAIEAFFSWTEHVFIHLALLQGKLSNAEEVAKLAGSEWSSKYKTALPLDDIQSKRWFDELIHIKNEVRNYIAHGAFGKQGEAFTFHSGAGAVPVLLPHNKQSKKYSLGAGLELKVEEALLVIDDFVEYLWSGPREPAKIYIQRSELPIIMTMVADGSYATAMTSVESMEGFVDHLSGEFDRAANMDW